MEYGLLTYACVGPGCLHSSVLFSELCGKSHREGGAPHKIMHRALKKLGTALERMHQWCVVMNYGKCFLFVHFIYFKIQNKSQK